jgi:hypothetical protein
MTMLDAALELHRHGCCVVATCDPTHPPGQCIDGQEVPGRHRLRAATLLEALRRAWLTEHDETLPMATGDVLERWANHEHEICRREAELARDLDQEGTAP